MRAVVVDQFGGVEKLQVKEIPVPEQKGLVQVKLAYVGVNFVDLYQREGRYPGASVPMHLGIEGAGVVQTVPKGSSFKAGDRVAFCTGVQGAYAEFVSIPEACLVKVPTALSLKEAAAVIEQGLTARMLMFDVARLRANSSVLVHAAAGGVGGLLVQMLLTEGHQVFATASTADKRAWLQAQGALALSYDHWLADLHQQTQKKGVDVVFDSIGKDTFANSLNATKSRGHVVLYGAASGQPAPIEVLALMQKSLTVSRPRIGQYFEDSQTLRGAADRLFTSITDGDLKLRIHAEFPLDEVAKAHELLASRATHGKVLLVVNGEFS